MLIFQRTIFRKLKDFNPAEGNFLLFGLMALILDYQVLILCGFKKTMLIWRELILT